MATLRHEATRLGIRGLYTGKNVSLAQVVLDAARLVKAAGITLPQAVEVVDASFFRTFNGGRADGGDRTFASYIVAPYDTVAVNGSADWSRIADYMREKGPQGSRWLSTGQACHVLVHEFGHRAHCEADPKRYDQLTQVSGVPAAVRGQVGNYAEASPAEFVAEVFAGLVLGRRFGRAVMKQYAKFGGPEITAA